MRLILEKLSRLSIGWNERVLDECDAYRLAGRHKVKIVEMPLTTGGFYYRVMGRDYIAIDSRLTGARKLFVLYHELAHYLLHTPEHGATANFHHVGRRTRQEYEADAVALCAIIPITMIGQLQAGDCPILDELPAEFVAERLRLYELHNI